MVLQVHTPPPQKKKKKKKTHKEPRVKSSLTKHHKTQENEKSLQTKKPRT